MRHTGIGIATVLMCVAAPRMQGQGASGRAAREALLALDRAPRSLASALGDDALVLLEGAPILRSAGAVRYLAAQAELRAARLRWLPLAALLAADGSLGVTYGVAVIDDSAGGQRFGKYVSVWARRDDAWRLVAHVVTGLLQHPDASVAGIARAAPTTPDARAAPFAAVDVAFARLAADSGAPAAFAAFAAPTGVTFPPTGEILIGPAAIRARMEENPNRLSWVWAPVFAGASGDGELGFTVGEAVLTGGGGTFYSKYLTVWRRMPNGSIRFLADAGNQRPTP